MTFLKHFNLHKYSVSNYELRKIWKTSDYDHLKSPCAHYNQFSTTHIYATTDVNIQSELTQKLVNGLEKNPHYCKIVSLKV